MSTLHASQDLINLIKQTILDTSHPIGSTYITRGNENPNDTLGGTWIKLYGGFLYACQTTADDHTCNTTGAITGSTAITINQMPSHNHGQDAHAHYVGHYRNWEFVKSMGYYAAGGGAAWPKTGNGASNSGDNYAMATESKQPGIWYTGGGQGHTHDMSRIGVFIWQRTA